MDNSFEINNIIPENDQERIAVLKRYKIANTPAEQAFDNVAKLTAQIFSVPIALISLVDTDSVFYKANIGMEKIKSVARAQSLCSVAILDDKVLVSDQPTGYKFYAGAPLITNDGFRIGTLCIVDTKSKSFFPQDEEILKGMARIVMDEIELRLTGITEIVSTRQLLTASQEEQQTLNEELITTVEELAASNEEMLITNEALAATHKALNTKVKELQKSEEMLRFSIESANVGTWYFDLETETFTPSLSLKKLFGYRTDEEMTYQDILVQISENYRNKVIAAASGTIYKGANYNVEFSATGFHDQKLRWLKAIGKLDHDTNGKLSHFSGVVIEITEQKQDEIRKNDFIAMVSHELKTPLTSLKGYIQLLTSKAKKTEDPFTISALERGNTQITKMTAMINGFLNVSRLEAGKIHLDKQPFALNQLMHDIVDEIIMTTQGHEIIMLPAAPLTINADADKIGQVLNNFLSNAVKYSPLTSRIEVAAIEIDGMIQVSVKDEGMGINPEDIERLFDRFYRVENQHAQNISGFGIGLYLCAEIVNRHDGKIWVNSENGNGSTFYFSIPKYK